MEIEKLYMQRNVQHTWMKISKYLEFKAFKKKFLSAHADCISMIFPDISTEKAKILKTNSTSTKTRIGKARES